MKQRHLPYQEGYEIVRKRTKSHKNIYWREHVELNLNTCELCGRVFSSKTGLHLNNKNIGFYKESIIVMDFPQGLRPPLSKWDKEYDTILNFTRDFTYTNKFIKEVGQGYQLPHPSGHKIRLDSTLFQEENFKNKQICFENRFLISF